MTTAVAEHIQESAPVAPTTEPAPEAKKGIFGRMWAWMKAHKTALVVLAL